jgi:hypothetical protein
MTIENLPTPVYLYIFIHRHTCGRSRVWGLGGRGRGLGRVLLRLESRVRCVPPNWEAEREGGKGGD